MSERKSHTSEPSDRRQFTTDEALEIESDRWRRVVAAFLQGGARADRPALRPWRGIVAGIGLTAAIVVVVGVVGVAGATLAASGTPRSGVSPSPGVTVVAPATPHPGAELAPTPVRPSPTLDR